MSLIGQWVQVQPREPLVQGVMWARHPPATISVRLSECTPCLTSDVSMPSCAQAPLESLRVVTSTLGCNLFDAWHAACGPWGGRVQPQLECRKRPTLSTVQAGS